MELNKVNSLVELFFKKYKEKKELKNQPFLKWLKANKNNFLKVINAPPNIGGRFSSSTSYGVLPATFMNNMLDSHKNNYK